MIAHGIDLKERIQKNDPKEKIYSALLQATGHVSLLDSESIVEEKFLGEEGYASIPFETGSCSVTTSAVLSEVS